jgi:ribosomal protein L32
VSGGRVSQSWPLPLSLVILPQYPLHYLPCHLPPYLGYHGRCHSFLPFATSSHRSSSPYPKRRSHILGKPCAVQTRASKINRVRDIFSGGHLYHVLNNLADLVHCPGCGSAKLAHHLCPHCYSSISRAWKSKPRNDGSASMSEVSP